MIKIAKIVGEILSRKYSIEVLVDGPARCSEGCKWLFRDKINNPSCKLFHQHLCYTRNNEKKAVQSLECRYAIGDLSEEKYQEIKSWENNS